MGRQRTSASRERDNRAWAYRRSGLSYDQVARAAGYASVSGAYKAVQRAIAENAAENGDEARQIEAARLDDLTRTLMRVLTTKHYIVATNGAVVRDPETREPLADDGPVIQAVAGLTRISERRAKLLGLDAPARRDVTIDMVNQEIMTLEQQLTAAHRQAGSRSQQLN